MVSVLDLDVLYYPCPKGSPTFRPKVLEMGGKKQFPYMVCDTSLMVVVSSSTYLWNVILEIWWRFTINYTNVAELFIPGQDWILSHWHDLLFITKLNQGILLPSLKWTMHDGDNITLMLQVDPNTGVAMYESDDIINYLAKTYGLYSIVFCFFTVHAFPSLTSLF